MSSCRDCDYIALYQFHLLTNHRGPLHLPLVPQHSECQVRHQQTLAQTPHKRNGIEEVGVSATGVYPKMIERRAEEGRVQESRSGHEGVAHDGEEVPVKRKHTKEETRIGNGRVRLEDGEDAHEDGQGSERLGPQADG